MSKELLNSNLRLLKFLENNPNLSVEEIWNQEKTNISHLPFIHGTEHDGKVPSNSHLDYLSLIQKYSHNHAE